MSNWQQRLAPFIRSIESYYDALKYRLFDLLGSLRPVKIVPYRGHGTPNRLHVMGRVLKDRGVQPALEDDPLWKNLLNTLRRMASREVPHAHLRVQFQDVDQEIIADEEGMFETWVHPTYPLDRDKLWHPVTLTLLDPAPASDSEPVTASAEVLVPPRSARFGVISDIDDTVLQTDATNLMHMGWTVFTGNAYTRLPFPGVAAFCRALHGGSDGKARNPLFYVSNSPWNLYDLLAQFFRLHGIPVGPVLFLRNWGITRNEFLPTNQVEYKLPVVRQLLDTHADLPFILIGDSGEADPELYEKIVEKYGDRILAVYIRNVSAEDSERTRVIEALAAEVLEAGSTMVLAGDSLSLARHAADHGWIARSALSAIETEKKRDETPPSPFKKALGREEDEASTVVVEEEG